MPLTLIGHPFATVGMGEQLRSHVRACVAAGLAPRVLDIFGHAARTDPEHLTLVDPRETRALGDGIRVFHLNGDEIDRARERLEQLGQAFGGGHNVIVPAWELPRYPEPWAARLRGFDEVWALSGFIGSALLTAGIESVPIGQPVEPPPGYLLPRRHFGIRESAFAMLAAVDLTSHAARKNPEAVLALWDALRGADPFADIQLVLKVKEGDAAAEPWAAELRERVPEAVVIGAPLAASEMRSLIAACDCFVSLHRAEGFGRGLGEAMALGRLALGTGWSGNLDFMTEANAALVRHDLVAVAEGAYPHAAGQHWAEPDVAHAAELVRAAIADPDAARARAMRGRREVRLGYSDRAVGLRILARLEAIAAQIGAGVDRAA
ncbi:MAG TPA: glycosyltransferase [Acetobacteraceae bacterium]|nr:glycosyltransferase [Acetobacteraceae bacterium]